MNQSGVPYIQPQISTASINDKPVSITNITTTTIPISQSQNSHPASLVTTYNPNSNNQSELQPLSTPNYTLRNNPPELTKLYHKDLQVFV